MWMISSPRNCTAASTSAFPRLSVPACFNQAYINTYNYPNTKFIFKRSNICLHQILKLEQNTCKMCFLHRETNRSSNPLEANMSYKGGCKDSVISTRQPHSNQSLEPMDFLNDGCCLVTLFQHKIEAWWKFNYKCCHPYFFSMEL